MAQTVIPAFNARCERIGQKNCEFSVAPEPHRAKSGRFEGKTEKADFVDSTLAVAVLGANNGLESGVSVKKLQALQNYT